MGKLFKNKEESWLSFNERVLQEAEDSSVPLIERLRFLGIYSNNRDEFFRVRIANLKRLSNLKKKDLKSLENKPEETLKKLQKIVLKQEKRFLSCYKELIRSLEKEEIFIIDEQQIQPEHDKYIKTLFKEEIRPALVPIMLSEKRPFPWLKDRVSYLAITLILNKENTTHALIEVPSKTLGRFFVLPEIEGRKYVILLDDIIRYCTSMMFQNFDFKTFNAYSIKVTRDAELYMDEDISVSLIDKLSKSIKDRSEGDPVRFVYSKDLPESLLSFIRKKMLLKDSTHLIASGKYQNYRDFMSFPSLGKKKLTHKKLKHVPHKYLDGEKSYLNVIEKKDILLYYPYHDFNYLIDTLREAAIDPEVSSIKINLYRVAQNSKVMNALINAVKNGKKVLAVVELKARFDEEANIEWSEKLQKEGVRVIFGVQGLKVHAKLIVIEKKRKNKVIKYAHVGTGNFHEKTANIYTDISLFTCHTGITNEADKIFDFFENPYKVKRYTHLFVRGMCAIIPGIKGLSERIKVTSIIDKYLEHTRLAIFGNNGNEKHFISSADWMYRNLENRVEVTAPIYDEKVKKLIRKIINIQLSDNVKARVIDDEFSNKYVRNKQDKIRSQDVVREYLMENYSS